MADVGHFEYANFTFDCISGHFRSIRNFNFFTQAQVDQLQQAVQAARTSQDAVVHNVCELITVVNQTRFEETDTRLELAALADAYDQFVDAEGARWHRHVKSTHLLMIKEYVDTLLWLDAAVWKNIKTIDELQQSLRAGQLTEGLCPMEFLGTIEQLARGHGLRSLPIEWYYENVPVLPLMIQQEIMTFRIILPFTNERIYKRYQIQAFPVPIDDQGLYTLIESGKMPTPASEALSPDTGPIGSSARSCRRGPTPLRRENYSKVYSFCIRSGRTFG